MSSSAGTIANRYARAIFEYVGNAEKVRNLLSELKQFQSVMESHLQLTDVFSSEVFSVKDRRAVLEDLAKKMQLSDAAVRVLFVLSEKTRLPLLGDVIERLRLRLLNSLEVMPLKVASAKELDSDDKKRLEERFAKLFGRGIEATYVTDTNLIGGIRATAGERTFDGSLTGWLSTLEETLAEGSMA